MCILERRMRLLRWQQHASMLLFTDCLELQSPPQSLTHEIYPMPWIVQRSLKMSTLTFHGSWNFKIETIRDERTVIEVKMYVSVTGTAHGLTDSSLGSRRSVVGCNNLIKSHPVNKLSRILGIKRNIHLTPSDNKVSLIIWLMQHPAKSSPSQEQRSYSLLSMGVIIPSRLAKKQFYPRESN